MHRLISEPTIETTHPTLRLPALVHNRLPLAIPDAYTFNAQSNALLLANTTYWLTLTPSPANTTNLVVASNSASITPTSPTNLATYVGVRLSDGVAPPIEPPGFNAPSFEINGSTSVPEPTSLGTIGLLAAGAVLRRLRQRARATQAV